jgi:hypothetical protein
VGREMRRSMILRRRFFGILSLFLLTVALQGAEPFDLNSASYEQISSLPISEGQARAIYELLTYEGPIRSIYELRALPEIDQATLLKIKPLVRVDPPDAADDRQTPGN